MAVNPGPGSVIYRGLAAVNVGGVIVAMVFSLLLLPSLMRLTTRTKQNVPMIEKDVDAAVVPRAA